jgi:hypothetical protein
VIQWRNGDSFNRNKQQRSEPRIDLSSVKIAGVT